MWMLSLESMAMEFSKPELMEGVPVSIVEYSQEPLSSVAYFSELTLMTNCPVYAM